MRFDHRIYGPGPTRAARVLLARPGRDYSDREVAEIRAHGGDIDPVAGGPVPGAHVVLATADPGEFVALDPTELTAEQVPAAPADPVRHVGGGTYELPDGRRIRGRDAALAAIEEG